MGQGLLLVDGSLPGGGQADIRLADARVAAIEAPNVLVPQPGEVSIDVSGASVLPAFVEPHAHIDKSFTADQVPNPSYDLSGAIAAWLAHRERFSPEEMAARARAAALRYLANGVTVVRTHTDVGIGVGVRTVEALAGVRKELAGLIDIQIVALPSLPYSGIAGADNRALLRESLEAGVDVVGGAAYLDEDPDASLEFLAGLAAEYDRPLDLHVDEVLTSDVFTLPDLIGLIRGGFASPITASHCVSLGSQEPSRQAAVAEAAADAGVRVVTLPITNLYLQARGLAPAPRGLTALRPLIDAGVTVAGGADNLRDPFNPMGRADPLETASLLVTAGHLRPEEALDMVTGSAGEVVGGGRRRLEVGAAADLVVVPGKSPAEVIGGAHPARLVIKGGAVVAATSVNTQFPALAGEKLVEWTWLQ